jgi:hypothetical protein
MAKIFLTLLLASLALAISETEKLKACILFGRSYMANEIRSLEEFTYQNSLNMEEFRAAYVLRVYDTCLEKIPAA